MDRDTHVTTDHEQIRLWSDSHKAHPEIIENTEALAEAPVLRLEFPGEGEEDLSENRSPHRVSWEEFFQKFEELGLAFEYEDTEGLDPSVAYHFIKRDTGSADDIPFIV
jgi:hypothetical protein